jgi:hypothetical protein
MVEWLVLSIAVLAAGFGLHTYRRYLLNDRIRRWHEDLRAEMEQAGGVEAWKRGKIKDSAHQ